MRGRFLRITHSRLKSVTSIRLKEQQGSSLNGEKTGWCRDAPTRAATTVSDYQPLVADAPSENPKRFAPGYSVITRFPRNVPVSAYQRGPEVNLQMHGNSPHLQHREGKGLYMSYKIRRCCL